MNQLAPDEPLKVLVIEDSEEDRELYRRLLEKNSDIQFTIYETDNAKEGLELSKKNRPDCIILDYQLPDGTGMDFIQSFKHNGGATAIVMVTGQGNERTAVEALHLGAVDYITKESIPDGFFIQSIMNAIERARLKNQVVQYQRELEKTNQALSEFAHTVSHDLKAPLRHITSYCDLLKEDAKEQLDGKKMEYISRMSVNVRRMQRMIDDLLIYSRVIHSREEKREVALNLVFQEVVEELDPAIKASGAHITSDPLPLVKTYPVRIRQLFQNLIGNALKYRGEKTPEISVHCVDKGAYYLLSFEDNGIGIEEKHLKNIFKPFERLHSQEQIEGTGLGLSICKKVVEMHNGRIWAESTPGEGSVFKVSLPKTG